MLASNRFLPLSRLRLLAGGLVLSGSLMGCQPQPAAPTPSASPQPASHASREEAEQPRRRHTGSAVAGDDRFDYYLLNLSWSPEFCSTHPNAAECAEHRAFTLHGLWPQRFDGSYAERCSDEPGPVDPGRFRDLYPDAGLLRHEWEAHGTCSGLDPETFFDEARRATNTVRIPPALAQLDRQISMPPDAILALFTQADPGLSRQSLALSCGNNFLTAVEVCLDKQLHAISCGPIRSCRANTVRIPPVRP